MPDPTNPNLYGQPYVKGPDPINIGSINSAPLSTGFPGSRSGKALSQDDMINLQNRQVDPNEIKADKTYLSDVASDLTGRYDTVIYGANNEDAWGAQQSWLDKGVNGVLKGTNLAATTVVGGFATVGGAISSIFTGRLADIWDNPVMQEIDKWNEKVDQEYLPNYYTDQEKNAEWYSPDNWWTANFLFDKVIKNSGFAVGAIISGNIASKALSATGTVIGEAAAARAAALEASQTFKAYAPLMRNTARAFSSGKNAEAAALLEGEISSIADVAAKTSRMGEIALETNQFAKINDVGRRIGIAAYSQAGEAAFEGLQTSNQFRQQLIDQYKMNNFGVAPSAEELKIIDQQTEKVGKTSFLANMALLSVTEYIQLPKLLGSSYAAEKQAANSLLGRADNVVLKDGKYVAEEVAKTKFGKLYNTVKGVGKYAFDPKEMGQEIGQYAIQIGTQNYYNKAYQGKEANVLVDGVLYGMFGRDGSGEGVGALVSKEGIEGGIIGGLTGAAMQAKGNYMMSKATKSNTADFLELLNGAPTYKEAFQYKLDAANRGVVLQEQQQAAIEAGDKLEAKDLNADMMHNYLAPRIKYGRMDMVMDDIQDMRKQSMSPDGMASLKQLGLANMNDTAESFSNKLAYFEQTAKYTEELFKSTNLRYSGEILKDDEGNPILNSKGQPQRKYSDQVIDKMIYAASKVADYDVRIPEVSMLPVSKGVDVQSVLNAELTDPQSEVIAEALIGIELSSNINKADIKQNVIDVLEMSLRRKEYLKEYNDLITNPQKYNEERQEFQTPEDTKTSKETISIKTKRGVRDIEIGTEYFLGKVVDFDDKGYEVYRAPRMVVLGRNEDGTIKVQDSDGVIHDLKESTLERYNLGKVDSTLNNKKAKFYMEHWNMVYEFNFGKKYGKQKGRIEYNPETDQMLFKYKNKKGEIKEIEVTGDQFKLTEANKKKGFTEPMIREVGPLTAVQQKAKDEYTAEEDPRIQAKREARLGILNDLFDTLADKQIKIERTIDAKQKEVVKAKEEYEKLTKEIEAAELDKRSKKVDKFKAVTARAIDNAMRLSRMQEQLEREIEALKLDAEEIDATLNYITDMASNIDEYSTNFKDFMDELQDEIIDLEILQETTQAQISTLSKLARETQRALDATIDYLSNLIANFESRYPNVPRLMGQDWVDFLKANPNFLKVKPNYRSDLQLIDDIIAETEDLEITPNEQRLKDLIEHMDIMQGALDDVQKEIEAKEMILNKFKQVADKYKQQEAEKKKLESDQALQAEYLGTNSKDVQSFFSNEFYEASSKKDDLEVVGSTIAVTRGREGEQIREHHARANRFGFNMHKFANKGSIRGMIVTAATEAEAGIDGLMNYLTDEGRAIDSQGKPINPNKIIALVMVQDNDDNTYTLVDENGVPLTKEQLADPTKHAIFQVFPADELEATYTSEDGKRERGSMFRKMTTDGKLTPAQESLKQQYNKWRAARLAEETVPTPQSISASFGIPDYVTYKDDKGKDVRDYDARVAVEETGLLEEGALLEDPVLMVATKNEAVTYGSVTFNTPLGRVFLKVPGGLLKLKNRNLTENEVNTIYDVLLQVTKNVDKDGTTKTAETQYLFNWLKTVVYWGIPRNTQTKEKKNPGYNSVWFENVTEGNVTYPKLFLSGLGGEGFDFTVNGLQNSENEIKAILRGMYNNVNSTKVNTESFKKKYTEIIGIDEAGQPIKRDWDNYQTYLLSAEGRTNEEIPLVTQVRPLTDPSVPNKKGIYFTLDSTIDSYEIPVPPPVVTQAPTPAAPTKTAVTVSKDALEKIKTAINAEENIAPLMDNIFKTINEAAYEAWQETLDQAQLQSDLTPILEPLKGDEDKVMSAVSKYLLNRYIDEQLVALDKTAQQTPAPAATVQPGAQKEYNLEGEENIYTCKFGKIPFKINAQEYIDSKGEKGFSITFEAETMAALMTEKGLDPSNNKDLDKARAIFYGAILAKIRPQLDAFQTKSKIPASDAPQTTFVLDGIAENTVQIGSHGKITFTLDGKKFNESGQGFNIQFGSFDGEVLNSVADAKGVSPAEAQQLIGNDIYMKVLQQLEALKIPVAPAIATPFTPNVEVVPEVTDKKADIEKRRQAELEENKKLGVQDLKTKVAEQFDTLEETRNKLKQEVSDDASLSEQDKELLTLAIDGIFDIPGSNPYITDDYEGYAAYDPKKFEQYMLYNFPNLTKDQIRDVLSKHIEPIATQHSASLLASLEGPSGLPNNLAELNADKINAKYDAELAALESTEEVISPNLKSNIDNFEKDVNKGWKMHLSIKGVEQFESENDDTPADEIRSRATETIKILDDLKSKGLIKGYKIGKDGGQPGKNITIYIGNANKVQAIVDAVEKSSELRDQNISDNLKLTNKISVRFQVDGKIEQGKDDVTFLRYGPLGIGLMKEVIEGDKADNMFNPKFLPETIKGLNYYLGDYFSGSKLINDRLNAELATLKSTEEVIVTPPATEQTAKPSKFASRQRGQKPDDAAMRVVVARQAKKFQGEDWKKLEKWIGEKFPNIPVYRVKNIIQATNGKQAWGMLHNGAIYIYENAEVGTVYHEVFEAVWKMFADAKEKEAILKEFTSREGTFVDRETGRTVEYKYATAHQIKEELAEEFRDAVLNDKLGKSIASKSLIGKLFSQLIDFIKSFFYGKDAQRNTKELFNKIGDGYYNTFNPYVSQLAYANVGVIDIENASADDFSDLRVTGIPAVQLHEIIDEMTFITLTDLIKRKESLFNIVKPRQKELYEMLNVRILDVIGHQADLIEQDKRDGRLTEEEGDKLYNDIGTLYDTVDAQWESIIERHKEKLKTFNIQFDENDELDISEFEKSKEDPFGDARKIDSFRKANGAVKLLLGTLPLSYVGVNEKGERELKVEKSSIGGAILIPADSVFIRLKNKLFDSVNIDDMLDRLREMAKGDPNFENLYTRLTKSSITAPIDVRSLDESSWQLITAFWKSMKSQNADAISVFIMPGGDVVVSDSTLTSAAKQAKRDMTNTMVDKIKSNSTFFSYEPKTGRYYATDKIKSMPLSGSDLTTYTALLNELGIEFNIKALSRLTDNQALAFRGAVEGIKRVFSDLNDKGKAKTDAEIENDEANGEVARGIVSLTPRALNIEGNLFQLGLVQAVIENKEFESTYFNMNGERTQTYIGVNALSGLHNILSKLDNITELSSNPAYKQYEYLRNDVFAKGSVMMQKMFNLHPTKGTGKRIAGTQDLMKSVYIDGMDNQVRGVKKESSKLSAKERLVQEINLNLNGYYLNLVPGDAAIEWAVKMHNDLAFVTKEEYADKDHYEIFKNYFISEVELARDGRNIVENENRKPTDLRFFKSILGEELNNKITKGAYRKYTAEELYNGKPSEGFKGFRSEINEAVDEFIKKDAADTEALLKNYGIVYYGSEGLTIDDIKLDNELELNEKTLRDQLQVLSINYMIANIEMHKLLYSDPYQYSDELKRIKNFNSPRQALLVGSQDVNAALNEIYNKGFKPGDAGYTDMTLDYFRTITLGDILSVSDLKDYDPYKETDGGGYIMLKANRVFGIRSGEWTEANEAQYRHDMAYEDLVRSGASKREIEKFDRNSPEVASTYTPRKPIVSGNKANGRDYNDVVLHKFALLPLSFRLLHKMNPDSNAIKLYDKMQKENIDYAVFESGSKVGAEKISPLYDKKGKFDETPFEDANAGINIYEKQAVSNIPFAIMGVQAEVPSKDAAYVTQGSQVTKLATLDFMEAGVPIDFDVNNGDFNARFIKWIKLSPEQKLKESELYKDIKHNQDMLNAKIEYGYKSLLKKLGITKTADGFIISNINKLTDTLRDEILKREVNDNISDALKGFKSGDVVLEATPAYQQIRNILYSIADKNVVSPKISGGMKVQIPSTLLESERPGQQVVKGKNVYSSNLLKFYTRNENGKTINVCQLMVGKWFKSDMSDEELINYFNNDPEGKKEFEAIMGVAFRIPTQKQNSIDVFEIAKFLPEGYKDSVVIPSELVMKAGSDFDIDKLSIYLKNIYPSNDKKPKVVPYLGVGQEAIDKFGKMYDAGEFNEYLNSKKLLSKGEAEDRLMEAIFPEQYSTQREDVINDLYRQSLENEYIQSLQKLISNDLNFDNLIKPNSADDLKELTDKINDKLGRTKIDYGAVGNMLSRAFMTNLRHAFVTGKYAIGIAAVNQTNHAQNQRSLIYVDPVKIKTTVDPVDAGWLGDGQINFNEYNSVMVNGVKRATLSKIKSADDKTYISDTIGQFIDGYVDISKGPWIMEMGATPNVASTWLFLVKLGVPINTVGYFMNQPIIRDYLRTIQNNGYSWLFIEKFVDDVKYDYLTEDNVVVNGIPNETDLYDMMGKSPEKMSPSELAQQNYILDEFLKYAMMASHMFQVTQGSNFDTATINDPYLVFKKQMQLAKAQRTMFSSINEKNEVVPAVDSILKNSFVGELANVIYGVRDAFAEILISDKKNVRKVMEQVLAPYTEMSDRDFIKISQKAVNDLFDWAVQNDRKLNNSVKKILLGNSTEKSAAKQIIEFRDKVLKDETHPLHNNMILKSLQLESGKKIVLDEYKLKDGNVYQRENISLELLMKLGYAPKESRKMMNMFIASPDNISIKGKDAKVYDQNMIIYGFNELKEKLGDENKDLYGKLVRLAVIQSGLTNSPIAFTNLLPYDDFKEFYNQTLSNLENIPNLADFKTLDTMERSNWNNTNVVVFKKGRLQESKATPGNWYYPERQFLSKKLEKKMLNGELPEMVVIPIRSREGRSDFMTYSYEGQITKAQRIKARRIGDTSHVNKGLFKKVYKINDEGKRVPLIQESTFKGKNGVERTYLNYVYKMINAWGDSYRAQEFYGKEFPLDPNSTVSRPSVLDNGFMKVMREVEDSEIELALLGTTPVVATIQPTKNVEVVDRYSVADVQANPDKIYVFGDNTQRVGMGGQAQIRNNPNAMGIATKITPSMDEAAFMSDKDLIKNRQIIDGDIAKIKATGKTVVMPKDGLGTGLAQLKEKAPQTYAYLKQRLLQEFGFDNDNGSINNDPQAPAPVAEPVVEAPRSTKERVLKDGKSYNLSDIGIDMLIKLGYSNEEIGKILKEVRKEIC